MRVTKDGNGLESDDEERLEANDMDSGGIDRLLLVLVLVGIVIVVVFAVRVVAVVVLAMLWRNVWLCPCLVPCRRLVTVGWWRIVVGLIIRLRFRLPG